MAGAALTISMVDEVEALRRRADHRDDVLRLPDPDADRAVALVFTSGTTGMPRGALFLDRQLAAATMIDTGGVWGDAELDPTPMMSATEFAHVGFMTKLPWYLRTGSTTHLLSAGELRMRSRSSPNSGSHRSVASRRRLR